MNATSKPISKGKSKKIAIIGCGKMVQSLLAPMQSQGLLHGWHIHCSSRTLASAQQLAKTLGSNHFGTDNKAAVTNADVILLGIKPYQAEAVCEQIQATLNTTLATKSCHVVSVMAGISIATLQAWLGVEAISRLMPNTPTQVAQGLTAMCHSSSTSAKQQQWLEDLLASTGKVMPMAEEALIHAITATSGSGPAYFFMMMQAMQQAAEEMGLSPQQAKQAVIQTAVGAANLAAMDSTKCFQELCDDIGVKGSATAAALDHFHQADLHAIVAKAMQASAQKSQQWQQQFTHCASHPSHLSS